jgi:hypothetical protein
MEHMDQSDIMMDALRTDRATVANETAGTFHVLFQDGSSFVAPGLTKREYFAAVAMQGIAAEYVEIHPKTSSISANAVAAFAVLLADNLIAELNK